MDDHATYTALTESIVRQPVLVLGGEEPRWLACVSALQEQLGIALEDTISLAGSATIDEVRVVLQRMQLKPVRGQRSLVCLYDIDQWTVERATTLLKTIEEPPSFVALCLFARTGSDLLSTIRSRVIVVRLPVDRPVVRQHAMAAGSLRDEFGQIASFVENGGSIDDLLPKWITGAPSAHAAAQLLQLRATIATAPVNRRLALEAALVAQRVGERS